MKVPVGVITLGVMVSKPTLLYVTEKPALATPALAVMAYGPPLTVAVLVLPKDVTVGKVLNTSLKA